MDKVEDSEKLEKLYKQTHKDFEIQQKKLGLYKEQANGYIAVSQFRDEKRRAHDGMGLSSVTETEQDQEEVEDDKVTAKSEISDERAQNDPMVLEVRNIINFRYLMMKSIRNLS